MVYKSLLIVLTLSLIFAIQCGDIFEENISKSTLTLISPADEAIFKGDTVSFWWDPVQGASQYEFHLVSPSFELAQRLLVDSTVSSNKLTLKVKPGAYQWEVRALNGGYATDYFFRSFSIDSVSSVDISTKKIEVIAPGDSVQLTNNQVTFWWKVLEGIDNYGFQLVSPDFSAVKEIVVDTLIEGNKLKISLGPGNYTWRVKGMNAQSQTEYTTQYFSLDSAKGANISESTVSLIVPQDELISSPSQMDFQWQAVGQATSYTFEIASPSIANPSVFFQNKVLDTNNFSIELEAGSYEWRVKATNATSSTGWSLRSFTLQQNGGVDISSRTVKLNAPANQLVSSNGEINFWWDAMADADEYELQIATPSFAEDQIISLVYEGKLAETKTSVNLDNGSYEWRVKATNATSSTDWSARQFKVQSNSGVDISAKVVKLNAPANMLVSESASINLWWDEVIDADQYELQIATPSFDEDKIVSLVRSEVLSDNRLTVNLDDGNYEWRVRALNSSSFTGWSLRSVKISTDPMTDISSSAVVLRAPANDLTTSNHQISLWWNVVTGAEEYELLIASPSLDEDKIEKLIYQKTLTSNIEEVTLDSGRYEWSVKALNAISETAPSVRSIYINK